MEYIIGICVVVLGGAIVIFFVNNFFNKKYDLDNVNINAREDRFYGNADIEDYDYDDEDRVEMFEDMIDFAKKAEDEEFERTVDEINKFVARRSAENTATMSGEEVVEVPQEVATQPVQVPVQAQVQVQTSVVEQPVVQQTRDITQEVVDGPDDYVEEL